jgi:hypothetical protein
MFPGLALHIVPICNRVEVRQNELADSGLLGYLSTLSCMQMDRARPIGWKRTVKNSQIGLSAETHKAGAVLGVS